MKTFNWLVCVCVGVLLSSGAGSLGFAQTPAGSGPGAEDIRSIRGPVEIPQPSSWEPLFVGALLALVIVAALGWLMRRENTRIFSARERAVAELEAAREWMSPETSREYSFAVSDALRTFIEVRFRLPSTRQTSEEFLRTLTEQPSFGLGVYAATLADFAKVSDLGKFGRWQLDTKVMEAMRSSALAVVESELSDTTERAAANPDQRREEDFLDPVSPVPAEAR